MSQIDLKDVRKCFSLTILSDLEQYIHNVCEFTENVCYCWFLSQTSHLHVFIEQTVIITSLFFTYTLIMCKFYIQTGTQTVFIGLCCIKTCQWLSANCSWSGMLNSYPITTNTIRLRKLYLWLLAWINLIFHIKIRSFGFLWSQMPRLKYQGFWAMFLRF